MAYERVLDSEKLLVVCNFFDTEAEFTVPEDFHLEKAECWITNTGREEFSKKITLKPYEAFVLKTTV